MTDVAAGYKRAQRSFTLLMLERDIVGAIITGVLVYAILRLALANVAGPEMRQAAAQVVSEREGRDAEAKLAGDASRFMRAG